MPKLSLCIASVDLHFLDQRKPLFLLLFVSQVANSRQEKIVVHGHGSHRICLQIALIHDERIVFLPWKDLRKLLSQLGNHLNGMLNLLNPCPVIELRSILEKRVLCSILV